MTIAEYLKQGRLLDQRINYHLRKLEELRASACTISSPRLSGDRVQTSPGRDAAFVRALERMEEMEERVTGEIDMLVDLKAQIEDMIHRLLNPEYQLMITYRYLEDMTWEEIGDLLHVDRITLYRWHKKALSMLQIPENPIVILKIAT